jgi:hypothetical protein
MLVGRARRGKEHSGQQRHSFKTINVLVCPTKAIGREERLDGFVFLKSGLFPTRSQTEVYNVRGEPSAPLVAREYTTSLQIG